MTLAVLAAGSRRENCAAVLSLRRTQAEEASGPASACTTACAAACASGPADFIRPAKAS